MKTQFNILFMDEAWDFILNLEVKTRAKVVFNIRKAQRISDPKLFKKINDCIWEFRTQYAQQQIRLLAFWSPKEKSLIVCTHGFYKKTQKTPISEIHKAERIRIKYLSPSQR